MLGDNNFWTEWEDNILLRKLETVRKDWLKSDWLAVSQQSACCFMV
jgi:hypothetical protein